MLKINDALEWRWSFRDDGPWLLDNLMLAVEGGRPSRKTSTVRTSQDRENQAIPGWREPSHPPDSWGTCRETSPSDCTEGHSGTWWRQPSNAQGDSVRPGMPGCCRRTENPLAFRHGECQTRTSSGSSGITIARIRLEDHLRLRQHRPDAARIARVSPILPRILLDKRPDEGLAELLRRGKLVLPDAYDVAVATRYCAGTGREPVPIALAIGPDGVPPTGEERPPRLGRRRAAMNLRAAPRRGRRPHD